MKKIVKKTVKRLTNAQINKIFALKSKGLTNVKIAEKVGCSDTTVGTYLNR
jgi:DNA-binding NarL/FixJ family response regulator